MILAIVKGIQAHFKTRSLALKPRGITDPRNRRGKRYRLERVWRSTLLALCLLTESTRRAVSIGRALPGRTGCGIGRTALSDLVSRLEPKEVRGMLRGQIHEEMHRKALRPVGLPLGVIAIDGKSVWTGDEKVNRFCQRSHKESGIPYWNFRVLRAVLVSASAPVCIDQAPIPADTNDMGAFGNFFAELQREYSRSQLFEVVTMDAGFCSEYNAHLVDDAGYGYVIGLKGNQPELLTEARRVLLPMANETPPQAASPWEREKGNFVQRRFWRTREMAKWLDWPHLRQVWLIRKVIRGINGEETVVEDRFFVTNLTIGRLNPDQCLTVVRRHWRIENDCYNTLDTQWREDTGFWSRKGNGLLVCSLMRMIAYNILWLLRVVHFKSRNHRSLPWMQLRDLVRDALVQIRTRAKRLVLNLV
jgi:predicted transposase YbfD/YdcC